MRIVAPCGTAPSAIDNEPKLHGAPPPPSQNTAPPATAGSECIEASNAASRYGRIHRACTEDSVLEAAWAADAIEYGEGRAKRHVRRALPSAVKGARVHARAHPRAGDP